MSNVLASLLLLTVLAGTDITGKWSGTIEVTNSAGESRSIPAFLIFKQEGDKLTGSGGPNEAEQYPMSTCVLDGEKLTFEVTVGAGTMSADLKVEGDQITGQIKRSDDTSRSGKLSVKRAAEK